MEKIIFVLKLFVSSLFTIIILILGLYVYAFITPKVNINEKDSIVLLDRNGNDIFNYKGYFVENGRDEE